MRQNECQCPYCGEPAETYVDASAGNRQQYVEDCAVCCRPIRFVVEYDADWDEFRVSALREAD